MINSRILREFIMFITEQQLALYKYQPKSRYYNWLMADIAISEYQTIIDDVKILEFLSCFYHRLIDINNNIWECVFPDKSIILIKENETGVYIKCLESINYNNVNIYFV